MKLRTEMKIYSQVHSASFVSNQSLHCKLKLPEKHRAAIVTAWGVHKFTAEKNPRKGSSINKLLWFWLENVMSESISRRLSSRVYRDNFQTFMVPFSTHLDSRVIPVLLLLWFPISHASLYSLPSRNYFAAKNKLILISAINLASVTLTSKYSFDDWKICWDEGNSDALFLILFVYNAVKVVLQLFNHKI